ncbi:MAG TPA: hypothetical protein VI216_02480 [Candidatus Acidoferrales bacterium]
MKGSKKGILWAALVAVIAIGAIASGLQAGPSEEGRFKLPFDAQVGKMTLQTGDYTFSVDRADGSYGLIRVYRGTESLGIMVPQELDSFHGQFGHAALLCIRHDGKVTVRALRLPNIGTFYFEMPKDLQTLLAQQPQMIETVPVQVSGE